MDHLRVIARGVGVGVVEGGAPEGRIQRLALVSPACKDATGDM